MHSGLILTQVRYGRFHVSAFEFPTSIFSFSPTWSVSTGKRNSTDLPQVYKVQVVCYALHQGMEARRRASCDQGDLYLGGEIRCGGTL